MSYNCFDSGFQFSEFPRKVSLKFGNRKTFRVNSLVCLNSMTNQLSGMLGQLFGQADFFRSSCFQNFLISFLSHTNSDKTIKLDKLVEISSLVGNRAVSEKNLIFCK